MMTRTKFYKIRHLISTKPPFGGFDIFENLHFRGLIFLLFFIGFFIGCNKPGEKVKRNDLIHLFSIDDYKSQPQSRDSMVAYIKKMPDDSLKTNLLFELSYFFYKTDNEKEFRLWNKETFRISSKLKDTLKIAESHWDKGNFYNKIGILDSSLFHYQRAYFYYNQQRNNFYAARMLLNIAILQKNIKDYTGSEVTTIKAISILKSLDKPEQLYIGYNNLGIVFNELKEHNTSLNYHFLALENAKLLNDNYWISTTLNNIGVAYIDNGNYHKAITAFEESLKNKDLRKSNARLYAMLIDNLAYAQFKQNPQLNLLKNFEVALEIRDSLNHEAGIVMNKIHMAEYLLLKKDSVLAKRFLKEALQLAEETNNHRDILSSLLWLSKGDRDNAVAYLQDYVTLNDSLQKEERAVRNKFERIRFETDEYIAKNSELSTQRNWIIAGSTGTVFLFSLLLVIRNQKAKNKKLQFEQKQNKANEEIYNLLLEQEKKREEGSRNEKMRISRELHDGVLGRLFGVRFVLGSHYEQSGESPDIKEKYLGELKSIEEEIRRISHDLQHNDGIKEVGFLQLIRNLLQDNENILLVKGELITDENIEWQKIPYKIKMNLYRIIQEALLNSAKHGKATKFTVNFQSKARNILLRISDNGCGFDLTKTTEGIGLSNMKDRVLDCKGNIDINSTESGTEIEIIIPV